MSAQPSVQPFSPATTTLGAADDAALARYHRQIIFPDFGIESQRRLLNATVVIVGCGATGAALSNLLVRAGVGRVRIIDRDFIELNNLQRQVLFDEADIAANLPKAEAAARKLRQVNRDVTVEGVVADVNPGNVLALLEDADVVLDGTDNFSTRFLLNDACLTLGKPWVYTGVIASYGMTATLIPDGAVERLPGHRAATACLRCLIQEVPAPGATPTCDTAGVIGPAVALLSAVAAAEAMKLLTGRGTLNPGVIHMDLWSHDYERFTAPRRPGCPACGEHRFEFLNAEMGAATTSLCGRNAVQVTVAGSRPLDLAALARQLAPVAGRVTYNDYLLRAHIGEHEFTVFPDNRAIIKGTEDEDLAKSLYARYIGG
ncbi:MAG TPA: ThiF family adenylyltransferase [Caldilineaceae bacterium]|nr:ThiF family adenylyltransferase [Caldilineaceae bacterium]